MTTKLLPVLTAGIGLAGALLPWSACSPGRSSAAPPGEANAAASQPWKLAVVFQVQGGRQAYVGTVDSPKTPKLPEPPPADGGKASSSCRLQNQIDYQVWLAAQGTTRGLWYSTQKHTFGCLSDAGEPGEGQADDGSLAALVRSARPAIDERGKVPGEGSHASWTPPPDSLEALCRRSDVIVVGQVVGILRNAHTPVNAATDPLQHTVYALAVTRYLKSDKQQHRPLLKVWQTGGWLPWVAPIGNVRGTGYHIHDDPMLAVGQHYLLFLGLPEDPLRRYQQLGYVPASSGGVEGKMAELDEYMRTSHWIGKLLIREGRTCAPAVLGDQAMDHWRFSKGPQILDMALPEACANIEQEVARQRRAGGLPQ
jgi:hypothetical protein